MGLQGVDRTLDVLEALIERGGASLGEVSEATGIPKSATYRVLQSLCERGYATQEQAAGRYRVGPRVLRLAQAGLEGVELRAVARPALERLAGATGETVHLVVPESDGVVYVDKVESNQTVRMASRVGMRGEMHSTGVGKAILAALPDEQVRALAGRTGLPPRTSRTITSVKALVAELERVRARGYAIDDEENEDDVRCVAMTVRDALGRPLGAVSISAPAYRLSKERMTRVVPLLRDTVAVIEEACRTSNPAGERAP